MAARPYDQVGIDILGNFQRGRDMRYQRERQPVLDQQHDQAFASQQQEVGQKQDDRELQQVGHIAGYLAKLPPDQRAIAYQSVLPKISPVLQKYGLPAPPPQWDESHLPELEQIAGMFGGAQQGTGVQSSFIDNQGRRVAIMRDGSTQILGQNAPNNQIIAGQGGYYGVNRNDLSAAPVTMGGPPQPQGPPQRQAGPVQFDFAPGTPQSVIDATKAYATADQGGGGMGGGQQLQPPDKAPAQGTDESFSQPQEVKGPDGKPMLVQFGNRGTMRPVQGFGVADNAQSANKEEMQNQRMIAQLSKRLADEQVPLVETQLSTIEATLRGLSGKDIPGFGRLDSLVPDKLAGTEALDLRQQVQSLANVILKSRSGAAVTDNELRRFLVEAGTGAMMPEAQLVKGIGLMRRWFNAQKSNIRGGYAPGVVQSYYDNAPENVGLLDVAPPKSGPGLGAPKAPRNVEYVRNASGKLVPKG